MAIVKVKPTSPGRRAMVKVVNKDLYKGKPHAALLDAQSVTAGRNNSGRITTRHKGGGHKQHYRMVDFRRNKDGIPAKIERLEYDPNRSANIALVLVRRRRTQVHHCSEGCNGGPGADVGFGSADSFGQYAADPQHPGRYHDSLHRNVARQGCANGAFGWHVRHAAGS